MSMFVEDVEENKRDCCLLSYSVFLYFDDVDFSLWEALQKNYCQKIGSTSHVKRIPLRCLVR